MFAARIDEGDLRGGRPRPGLRLGAERLDEQNADKPEGVPGGNGVHTLIKPGLM